MIDRVAAEEVRRLSLQAIESLSMILHVNGVQSDASMYKKLHRAVGELVGETQMKLLEELNRVYPDLDDL